MSSKPVILLIGEPIRYNLDVYERLQTQFKVLHPSTEERQRENFLTALRERRWGDFHAILRPFWNSGGEMGKWDRELVPLLPKTVKVFASAGAGYDWADTPLLAEHGILYCNGAAASSDAVAEAAMFHILSTFRHFMWSQLGARSLDKDQFQNAHENVPPIARNLTGKTLGIVGLGAIGFTIARRAYHGFGMRIQYYDIVRKSPEQEKSVKAEFFSSKEELAAKSDCVLVATPFFGEKLVDAKFLSHFKKGSRFVNIARGTLVDEDALIAALESGHISAAGLDVHANEPDVNPKFPGMKNVTVTSHTAGGTVDTWIGFEKLAMENIERVLTGQEPLTPVNKHLIKNYRPERARL